MENIIGSNHGDTITGNVTDNIIVTNLGNDNVDCIAGNDTLDYDYSITNGISVYLNGTQISILGTSEVDTVVNCENVVGTQ